MKETKYTVLRFGDRPRYMKDAMKHRKGKNIYVEQVYDTMKEAKENRGMSAKGVYKLPVGKLENVEQLPSAYYKGTLVEIEYN